MKISDAELTGLDLDMTGVDTASKAYDENAVLRAESSSSLESLSLTIAQASVGNLESDSSAADDGHEMDMVKSSSLSLSDLEIGGLDLNMEGYETLSKSYSKSGSLEEFSSMELASVSLKAENLKLAKLERSSMDSGDGHETSTLNLHGTNATNLDASLSGFEMTKELYGEDTILKEKTVRNIESLSAKIENVGFELNSHNVVKGDELITSKKDMSLDLSGALLETGVVEFSSQGIDENGQQKSWGLGVTDIGVAIDQLSFSSGVSTGEDVTWYEHRMWEVLFWRRAYWSLLLKPYRRGWVVELFRIGCRRPRSIP